MLLGHFDCYSRSVLVFDTKNVTGSVVLDDVAPEKFFAFVDHVGFMNKSLLIQTESGDNDTEPVLIGNINVTTQQVGFFSEQIDTCVQPLATMITTKTDLLAGIVSKTPSSVISSSMNGALGVVSMCDEGEHGIWIKKNASNQICWIKINTSSM